MSVLCSTVALRRLVIIFGFPTPWRTRRAAACSRPRWWDACGSVFRSWRPYPFRWKLWGGMIYSSLLRPGRRCQDWPVPCAVGAMKAKWTSFGRTFITGHCPRLLCSVPCSWLWPASRRRRRWRTFPRSLPELSTYGANFCAAVLPSLNNSAAVPLPILPATA